MGAPLQYQSHGSRREVIENPTEEQRQQEHVELMGNRIALSRRREHLRFETDWRPLGAVSQFARSAAQVTYLGAVSSSRFRKKDGTEVACAERWRELVESDLGEVEGGSSGLPKWPELSKTAVEAGIKAVVKGVIEFVMKQLD